MKEQNMCRKYKPLMLQIIGKPIKHQCLKMLIDTSMP